MAVVEELHFVCRISNLGISSLPYYCCLDTRNNQGMFTAAGQVKVPRFRRLRRGRPLLRDITAEVFCTCDAFLGYCFVGVSEQNHHDCIAVGRFSLFMDRLRVYDGFRHRPTTAAPDPPHMVHH